MTTEKFESLVNDICECGESFPYDVIDEVLDESFNKEFTTIFIKLLSELKKRKFENRGSPPKNAMRCKICNVIYWHLADGFLDEKAFSTEPPWNCLKCREGDMI